MSKAGLSVFVFGFYLIIVGLGFMIAPHWNLRLFGLSAGDDVWIRMVGMLASIIWSLLPLGGAGASGGVLPVDRAGPVLCCGLYDVDARARQSGAGDHALCRY